MNPKVGGPFLAFSRSAVCREGPSPWFVCSGWKRVQKGDSGGRRLSRWDGHAEDLPGSGAAPGGVLPVQRTDQVPRDADVLMVCPSKSLC